MRNRDAFQELVELERPAAYDPDTDRLVSPLGGGWWTLTGTDDLLDQDAVRELLAPGGWTLTGALLVLLYGREDDDDEMMARTRQYLETFERVYWPALAAMAHELGPDDRPSVKTRGAWLWAQSSDDLTPAPDPGKWCLFRDGATIDHAWEWIRAAVLIGRLYAAKCSTAARASSFGGVHVVCVYCPDSRDLDDVRRARAILRELGFAEELGYKTDRATAARLTGDAEWMLRE